MMLENAAKCEPVVAGLIRARDCGLSGQTLSHAGPPFADRRFIPKPVLHALAGSAVIEGWVKTFADGIAAILRPRSHNLEICFDRRCDCLL